MMEVQKNKNRFDLATKMSQTVQQSNDEVQGVIEFLNDAADVINNGKNNGDDY